MKHQMKKILALLMALVMVLSTLPMAAFAEEMEEEIELFSEFDAMADQLENTVVPEVQMAGADLEGTCVMGTPSLGGEELSSSSEVGTYNSLENILESVEEMETYDAFPSEVMKLRNAMKTRTPSITLEFNTYDSTYYSTTKMNNLWNSMIAEAVAHTGNPTEGDYIVCAISGEIKGSWRVGPEYPYPVTLTYNMVFNTFPSQEETMTTKVQSVVNSLKLGSKTNDYEKVKAIFDYMYSKMPCNLSTSGISAYDLLVDGLNSTNGFVTLFYRLCLEAGLDCRVIRGKADNLGHAWNIVRIGKKYYNVDVLRCRYEKTTKYFLKSNSAFSTYTRNGDYNTSSFNSTYPMATSNFSPCKTHKYSAGMCSNCGAKDSSHLEGMYRLYNPYTLEHMFNSNASEREKLQRLGWSLDGFAFYAPTNGTKPVYRLYNRAGDWHSYSADSTEIANLQNQGWTVDGIMCYSADSSGKPVFRLYNPYESINFLLFTSGVEERDKLVSLGWVYQGIAWYVIP